MTPSDEDRARPLVAHIATIDMAVKMVLLDQLVAIRDAGYRVIAVSAAGPDVPDIEARGIPHRAVSFTRRMTPIRDLASLVSLIRLFRRERPTIVHTHNPKPGLLGQIAARIAGVPIVVNTLHGFYFHEHMSAGRRRFWILLERVAARCSDLILSQNQEDIDTALSEGIVTDSRRIRHLGNGIDLARFHPSRFTAAAREEMRAGLGIAADAPVIGFVGRLVREKGILDLIEAVPAIRAAAPGAVFLFVGPADAEKSDGIDPAVIEQALPGDARRVLGRRDDMPEMYSIMDVFVLPSYREGFPRAAMEASAMGVPVVATDIRGCRDVVHDGVNGRLVRAGDPRRLAAALIEMLGDREAMARLGDAGVQVAARRFDQRRVFARVLEVYSEARASRCLSRQRHRGFRWRSARA